VQNPPYFDGMKKEPDPIVDVVDARILAMFGDKITTDHISPAGSIQTDLARRQVPQRASGAACRLQSIRHARGNHEVMMRGTFANIRIKNFMLKGADGNIPRAA